MKYNQLGQSDLTVSQMGLGTWVFAGKFWQGAQREGCIEAVHCAIDSGINFIDTAPLYGNGLSEQIVGEAIKGRRDKLIIATKCGLKNDADGISHNLKKERIVEELEQSLKNLNIECIDLYQCHWPDESTPLEETMSALSQLKNQGKIRYIGLSNFDLSQIDEASQFGEVISLQSQLSLLERGLEEEILPGCSDRNISVIAYGVLAGGVLTGKYEKQPFFKDPDVRMFFYKHYRGKSFEKALEIVKILKSLGKPAHHVAMNWVRQKQEVGSILVGARNAKQVKDNIEALQFELTKEELLMIDNTQVLQT